MYAHTCIHIPEWNKFKYYQLFFRLLGNYFCRSGVFHIFQICNGEIQGLVRFLKYANLEEGEEEFMSCSDSQETIVFISVPRIRNSEF